MPSESLARKFIRPQSITCKGETKSIHEWSRKTGINPETLWGRLKNGWTPEKVIETPLLRQSIDYERKRELARLASVRHRKRRIEAGLCVKCTSPVSETSKRLCEFHRIESNKYLAKQRIENPDREKERTKRNYIKNRTKRLAYIKKYVAENKEKVAAYKRSIRDIEKARKRSPESRAKKNAWRRAKIASDPAWAMADRLRKRVGRAIRDYAPGMKLRKTQEYIGCSMDEFMRHIESKFLPGMSWDNRSTWHLDHIRPCATFDLMDPEQQRVCFNYLNLQPLWSTDNIKKHATWNGVTRYAKA